MVESLINLMGGNGASTVKSFLRGTSSGSIPIGMYTESDSVSPFCEGLARVQYQLAWYTVGVICEDPLGFSTGEGMYTGGEIYEDPLGSVASMYTDGGGREWGFALVGCEFEMTHWMEDVAGSNDAGGCCACGRPVARAARVSRL